MKMTETIQDLHDRCDDDDDGDDDDKEDNEAGAPYTSRTKDVSDFQANFEASAAKVKCHGSYTGSLAC